MLLIWLFKYFSFLDFHLFCEYVQICINFPYLYSITLIWLKVDNDLTNYAPKCLYVMQHAYKYKSLNEMGFVDAKEK